MRLKVYLCREEKYESGIPRHHIAPIATCTLLCEVSAEEVPDRIKDEIAEKGEAILTEGIEGLECANVRLGRNEYLRIVPIDA